jgi:hypothetical protein
MLRRVRTIAFKIESTPGTAESLADADGALNVYDAIMQPTIEAVAREGQGGFSPIPTVLGARAGTCTFRFDLIGGATDPFWMLNILPACGFTANSGGVYSPKSQEPGAVVKTATIGLYQNGKLKVLRGAMGNLVFTFTSGQPAFVEATFTGIWVPPTDAAIIAPTKPATVPIRFASAGLTLGSGPGWTPKLSQMTLDLGNDVQLLEDQNDSSGYCYAHITGRRINGTMDPKATLVATEDTYGKWLAYNQRALAMTIGATGNRLSFAAPSFQITNVQEADRNGTEIDTITYELNRNGSTTDTDLTIQAD